MIEHVRDDTGCFPHMSTGNIPLTLAAVLRDNDRMPTEPEIFAERVARKRTEKGFKSDRDLSIHVTGKPDLIRDMKRKKSIPRGDNLVRLAEALGTTTEWLIGKADNDEVVRSEVAIRELPAGYRGDRENRIPVMATGYCDDMIIVTDEGELHIERVQLEMDRIVEYVDRPRSLWNSPDAYAIEFVGSSMEPVFDQGDLGVVDPKRKPRIGDDVVVHLNDGRSDDVITVIVKRLKAITSGWYEFEQFNPRTTFRVPRAQVSHLHRILRRFEMLGY